MEFSAHNQAEIQSLSKNTFEFVNVLAAHCVVCLNVFFGETLNSLLLLNFRGPAGGGERGCGCEVVPVILRSSICQGAFSSLSFILFMDKQILEDFITICISMSGC